MKLNKKTIIYLIAGIIISVIVIVLGLVSNNYLSKVIISQPFSVKIDEISAENGSAIKVFGYSPSGKKQELSNINEENSWKYFDYSNFKSLYIFIPDSLEIFDKAVIIINNHWIEVSDFKSIIINNYVDLTGFIKGKNSKLEVIFSIFHWKEVRFIVVIVAAFLSFIFLFLILRKNRNIKSPYKILWSIYGSALLLHILFVIFQGKYLLTTGIIIIVSVAILLLVILKSYERIRKSLGKYVGMRLTIISVSICLSLTELTFVLTGYKSTYSEKTEYYYESPYKPENTGWLHIMRGDHELVTNEYCYHRTINSEGLSDKEHDVVKRENEYRIIGLGDSFTEGDGADADSTWLKFLERGLIKHQLQKSITYLNAGVCGSDPYFEYALLKERLLKYKPDLVLLAVNCSDISDILLRGGMERFQPDGTLKYKKAPWWEPIYAMSHMSRLMFSALGYNDILLKEGENEFLEPKEKISEIIRSFKTLSEKENFKIIVIFHPVISEVNSNNFALKSVMDNVSENNRIEVLNLLDYYQKIEKMNSAKSNEYYWKYDGHHNAKGYAAFARGVEWKLRETGILDSLIKK